MPATAIDDRTFFILYALHINKELDIPNITMLYNGELDNCVSILKELIFIKQLEELNIKFIYNPSFINQSNRENICKYKEEIEQIIEQLNATNPVIDWNNPAVDYLLQVLECYIQVKKEYVDEFERNFENYCQSAQPTNRIYPYKKHQDYINKYLKSDDGKNIMPQPKIKISRITSLIPDYNKTYTRYNFWHHFEKLEKKELIKVKNLFIDEREPTIDFIINNSKTFFLRKEKQTQLITRVENFELYNNKIVNSSTGVESIKIGGYKVKLLKYALENPTGMRKIRRAELARICGVDYKNITRATSAVNCVFKGIINDKDFKLIELKKYNDDFIINDVGDIQ